MQVQDLLLDSVSNRVPPSWKGCLLLLIHARWTLIQKSSLDWDGEHLVPAANSWLANKKNLDQDELEFNNKIIYRKQE